ncbi:MAG: hypothetical protein AB4911_21875 [Oscillochloridaceae bacterium umkhey_bin13]
MQLNCFPYGIRWLALAFAILVLPFAALPLRAQPSGTIRFATDELLVLESEEVALIELIRDDGVGAVAARVAITPGSADPSDYLADPATLDGDFADLQLNGQVTAIARQPDGKIIIGGNFSMAGGQPRMRLARLHPDGSLDLDFNSTANGLVRALAVQPDGNILVGGFFSSIAGVSQRGLARLRSDGSFDSTFTVNVGTSAGEGVRDLAVQGDGTIIVAGIFSSIAGQTQSHVARLSASGVFDTSFTPQLNGPVYTVLVQPNGSVLIGGQFTQVNAQPRIRLTRLTATGALDAYNPFNGPNNEVYALALQPDGKILAVGAFDAVSAISPRPRPGLVRFEEDGNLDADFDLGGTTTGVINRVVVQPDGKILIGGQFSNSNLPDQPNLVRLSANGVPDPSFDAGQGPDGPIQDLLLQPDGKILIGGFFNRYDLDTAAPDMLARVRGDLFAVWESGETAPRTLRLPIVADGISEEVETVTLTIEPFTATAGTPATMTLRIRDGNRVPVVQSLSRNAPAGRDLVLTLPAEDGDGDPLSLTITSLPTRATLYQYSAAGRGASISEPDTVVSDPGRRIIVAPEPGIRATTVSRFSFRAADAFSVSAPAEVTISFEPFRVYLPVVRR